MTTDVRRMGVAVGDRNGGRDMGGSRTVVLLQDVCKGRNAVMASTGQASAEESIKADGDKMANQPVQEWEEDFTVDLQWSDTGRLWLVVVSDDGASSRSYELTGGAVGPVRWDTK